MTVPLPVWKEVGQTMLPSCQHCLAACEHCLDFDSRQCPSTGFCPVQNPVLDKRLVLDFVVLDKIKYESAANGFCSVATDSSRMHSAVIVWDPWFGMRAFHMPTSPLRARLRSKCSRAPRLGFSFCKIFANLLRVETSAPPGPIFASGVRTQKWEQRWWNSKIKHF